MLRHAALLLVLCGAIAPAAAAEILKLAELTTDRIRALDRARTVVILPGGMMEEHGPYLPSFTDGILSERLTDELLKALAQKKPGWTALLMPSINVGASGYNEIGGHFTFPGTYAVRPSTLRAIFMDLASELGDQGFRWILVVHVHGSPHHIRALDQAGDFFRDTYGGRMVNVWGLLPVPGGWGKALAALSDAQKKEDGAALHAGMDEHSLMLHLQPELVDPGYKNAPRVTGATTRDSIAVAKDPKWPGYFGSPRLATAATGQRIWRLVADAAVDQTLQLLDGADPSKVPRFGEVLLKNPQYQEWIKAGEARDAAREAQQREWLAKRQ